MDLVVCFISSRPFERDQRICFIKYIRQSLRAPLVGYNAFSCKDKNDYSIKALILDFQNLGVRGEFLKQATFLQSPWQSLSPLSFFNVFVYSSPTKIYQLYTEDINSILYICSASTVQCKKTKHGIKVTFILLLLRVGA